MSRTILTRIQESRPNHNMNRPNFQQIEDSPEKNYMRYVGMYRLEDLVTSLHNPIAYLHSINIKL